MGNGGKKKVDAVFEGGGVRGIGLVGAAAVVEERGYAFENVAGTSAGAIVASLIAAGYSTPELTAIMREVTYTKFRDRSPFDRVPLVGPLTSLLVEKGIYEGDYFEGWLRDLLRAKGVRTFRDLVMREHANELRYRYRLQVVAADISNGRLLHLPHDIRDYGIAPDDLEVARAVRMSMSIPFFYEPVKLEDAEGRECFIVDGGVLSNFPVWIFDDGTSDPAWPTFGFRLVSGAAPSQNRVKGPVSFFVALAKTMLSAHDARYAKDADFVRTIAVESGDVGTTEFDLQPDKRDRLYESGREAARTFLEDWDFERYKKAFRENRPQESRGRRLRRASSPP
ncbi:MAG: patatin-like phospholipase family protein [Labilithrix sp.]|nr:patatin-like phospholipase family protein [Labilithrix sp.]MBX3222517.1 patatin-like phospholipase family protein [Labilithrix sp.]